VGTSNERAVPMLKQWIVAVRPFAYTASVLAVVLGSAVAVYAGHPIQWGLLVITLVGVVSFHTAANLLNDCFDHRRGLDTDVFPTSGAVVRGWLTEKQVFTAAGVFLVVGTICGFLLTWLTGWVVLLLGALGAVCALGYTTPRFCFKYVGGGDIAIFLSFGVLTVFGTFWVQVRHFDWLPVLWSIPLSMLTVGILHANNWRDIEGDSGKECRTVATRLGSNGSRIYYRVLMLGPFVLVALFAGLGLVPRMNLPTPPAVLISFFALPLALRLARITPRNDAGIFTMLDGKTAQLHLVFGVLCSVGFWISRYLPSLR